MGKIILELDVMMARRHMSLNDLADAVGITNVNLSKIKNNKVNAIRFSTLTGICQALKCEPGDILKYEEDEDE
jgi:putative transcriptional regulator